MLFLFRKCVHRTALIRAKRKNISCILHQINCWDTCQITNKSSNGKKKSHAEGAHSLVADNRTSLHPPHFSHPTAEKELGSEMHCQRALEGNQKPTRCRRVAGTGAGCSQDAEHPSHALVPCPTTLSVRQKHQNMSVSFSKLPVVAMRDYRSAIP